MPVKLNISEKGKTFHLEADIEPFILKKIGDTIEGHLINTDLSGYSLKITGGSDISGLPAFQEVEGQGHKRVLLKRGKGMWQSRPKGLRKRKTVHGNTIDRIMTQINLLVEKKGQKKLEDIFPDQNKPKEKEAPKQETQEANSNQ